MILPRISRRAALVLGKAAGALILTAVGGTVAWLLDQGRRRILEETPPEETEPELVIDLPREAEPENGPQSDVPEGTDEA